MAFQIKNFRSIVASMLNVARASQSQITDFSVGAVARTLMESPAVEIEELYLQMLLGLQDAIPMAVYQAFDFVAIDARPAGGVVTVSCSRTATDPLVLEVGTELYAPLSKQTFYSLTPVTVGTGASQFDLTVVAAVPGAVGNVGANEITQFTRANDFVDATFTHLALTSGRDAESDLERKTRFIEFVRALSRGTAQAIRYCAGMAVVKNGDGLVQEYVERVGFDEVAGLVNLYLLGSNGPPSVALITRCQQLVDGYSDPDTGMRVEGYRSAGVEVRVLAMQPRVVDLGVSVMGRIGVLHTGTLTQSVTDAVSRVIASVRAGSVLRADAVVTAVLGVPGVLSANLVNNSNIVCAQSEYLTPGVVTVEWLDNA